MATSAPSFRKMLHLANARESYLARKLQDALDEVDAALALDADFVPAQTLRRRIVEDAAGVRRKDVPAAGLRQQGWSAHERRALIGASLVAVAIIAFVLMIGTRCVLCQPDLEPPSRPLPAVAASAAMPITVAVTLPRLDSAPSARIGTPLVEWTSSRLARLDVRPEWRASAIHVEDPALLRDLGEGIAQLWVDALVEHADAIFAGDATQPDEWERFSAAIKPHGVVWRISSMPGESDLTGPRAAGFMLRRRQRYASHFVAEQFQLQRRAAN